MQQETRLRLRYMATDFAAANIGFCIFDIIRYGTIPASMKADSLIGFLTSPTLIAEQIAVPIIVVVLYAIFGSYNKGNTLYKSRLEETLTSLTVSIVAMLVVFFTALINDNIPERITNYELMLALFASLFIPAFISRMIVLTSIAKLIKKGSYVINTVVIGASPQNSKLIAKIMQSSILNGMRLTAAIDTDGSSAAEKIQGLKIIRTDDPSKTCADLGARAAVVLPSAKGLSKTAEIIDKLYRSGIRLFVSPDLHSMLGIRPRVSQITAEPMVDITNARISPALKNLKRIGDILFSSLALVLLTPVYAVISIAVKYGSPGPVFYSQERIGFHKKPFKIYKFRTMSRDAEENGPALSSDNDPRITPTGHFLRKYRLDELPQFWNVLKGDMSLVGPRPEREYYIRMITERVPAYSLVHQVRPGITSWGMVRYGYASNVDQMIERFRYDLLYLENVSLAVDLKILFHTVSTIIKGKGL